jgi:DNA-binding transcriptional ArsR family regulator
MGTQEYETLMQFFKALANENRLKILGILSNHECGVDELATLLDIKPPTVSHHLSLLRKLDLISLRMNGNDHLYRMNAGGLQAMSKDVFSSLTSDKVAALVDDVAYDSWEKKVLITFLEGDKIKAIPTGYKKRLAVLKWLVNYFDEDVKYTEQEVNSIIERHHPDYCTLRREFITNGLMARENGVYWRIAWQMPDLSG